MCYNHTTVTFLLRTGEIIRATDEVAIAVVFHMEIEDRKSKERIRPGQESEARLTPLVGQMPAFLWSTNIDLQVTSVLGAGLMGLGPEIRYNPGLSLFSFFQIDDPDSLPITAHRGALGGESVNFELSWADKVFHGRVEPLYGTDGIIIGCLGVALDISEYKNAETTLRISEEKFRYLAENIREVFWISNPTRTRIIYVSPAYEGVWGRTCKSAYEHPESFFESIHPEDRERVITALPAKAKDKSEEEFRILRSDGSVRWICSRAFAMTTEGGDVSCLVGVAEDITARKEAEERLVEQATLLDHAQDAIIICSLDDRITFWNRSAERMYGWRANEAIGRRIGDLIYEEKAIHEFEQAREKMLNHNEWSGETHQLTSDGEMLTVESKWVLVHDGRGKPKSILISNADITEKKKIEAQLLRAQRIDSIGALAAGIFHDINNVLSPVLVVVEALRLKLEDEESQTLLALLKTSTERGTALVDQVLYFARGLEGLHTTIQPNYLILEIVEFLKRTLPKTIEIKLLLQYDLWTVVGDATQLYQVLINLCLNAKDAMPCGGSLTIKVENVHTDEECPSDLGRSVRISVVDTGVGIPSHILDRVFEPFFTTRQSGQGTGLGLTTTLEIVKGHGGLIVVNSEVGKGTEFKVYLPATEPEQSVQAEQQPLKLAVGRGELILVVDDEVAVQVATKTALEAFGYRVLTAGDGVEAVRLYTRNRSDIKAVVADLIMPGISGLDTIHNLRQIDPQVNVIAVGGLVWTEKVAEEAKTAGAKILLRKPYSAGKLLDALAQVLVAR